VHDLLPLGPFGCAELGEGVDVELAAEDALVELHRLAGVVLEADVRVESGSHEALLDLVVVGPGQPADWE